MVQVRYLKVVLHNFFYNLHFLLLMISDYVTTNNVELETKTIKIIL